MVVENINDHFCIEICNNVGFAYIIFFSLAYNCLFLKKINIRTECLSIH